MALTEKDNSSLVSYHHLIVAKQSIKIKRMPEELSPSHKGTKQSYVNRPIFVLVCVSLFDFFMQKHPPLLLCQLSYSLSP